jgi:hypothetical protein
MSEEPTPLSPDFLCWNSDEGDKVPLKHWYPSTNLRIITTQKGIWYVACVWKGGRIVGFTVNLTF